MGSWFSSTRERIVLCGPSGAGKDYNVGLLRKAGYRIGVSHTTRPPREGEVDGEDYYFVNDTEFDKVDFFEASPLGTYRYGLSRKEWGAKQVFVLNPEGVANVVAMGDRASTFVIYLNISEHVRNVRLVERQWTEAEVEARAAVDTLSFASFSDFDLEIRGEHDIVSIVRDILPL